MAEEKKIQKTTKHKVIQEFTLDRLYRVGEPIELPSGKIKQTLISNKFIK